MSRKLFNKSENVSQSNHFINYYLNNVKVGYMTLDFENHRNSKIIEALQSDSELAQKLFGNDYITAVYSQRNEDNKKDIELPF